MNGYNGNKANQNDNNIELIKNLLISINHNQVKIAEKQLKLNKAISSILQNNVSSNEQQSSRNDNLASSGVSSLFPPIVSDFLNNEEVNNQAFTLLNKINNFVNQPQQLSRQQEHPQQQEDNENDLYKDMPELISDDEKKNNCEYNSLNTSQNIPHTRRASSVLRPSRELLRTNSTYQSFINRNNNASQAQTLELPNDTIVKVKSETTRGVNYDVNITKCTCECPSFKYRGPLMCKHIKLVKENSKSFNLVDGPVLDNFINTVSRF